MKLENEILDLGLPGPRRKAPVGGPYLKLEFPAWFRIDFLTDTGTWMDWGAYPDTAVEILSDGSYGLMSGGAPFIIRCIADHATFVVHIDGNGRGEIHYYRIVPIPPPGG